MPIITKYPTLNTVVTTGWTNPGNVGADDNVYATAAPAKSSSITSDWHGFGFDTDIPDGVTINSVTIEYGWFLDSSLSIATFFYTHVIGGTAAAELFNDTEPKTEIITSYSPTGLTRDNLLDANFKVRARAFRGNDNDAVTFNLDFVRVTVDYNPPPKNTEVRVGFPPISAGNIPRTGAGLQEFRVLVRKSGTGGDPSARIELYETNGTVPLATPLADTTVTNTTGVLLSGTWDAALLANPDGSAVECRVVGTGASGGTLEVGAVEWNATTIAGGSSSLVRTANSSLTSSSISRKVSTLVRAVTSSAISSSISNRVINRIRSTVSSATGSSLVNRLVSRFRQANANSITSSLSNRRTELRRVINSHAIANAIVNRIVSRIRSATSHSDVYSATSTAIKVLLRSVTSHATSSSITNRIINRIRSATSHGLASSVTSRFIHRIRISSASLGNATSSANRLNTIIRSALSFLTSSSNAVRLVHSIRSSSSLFLASSFASRIIQTAGSIIRTSISSMTSSARSSRVILLYRSLNAILTSNSYVTRVVVRIRLSVAYALISSLVNRLVARFRSTTTGDNFGSLSTTRKEFVRSSVSHSITSSYSSRIYEPAVGAWLDVVIDVEVEPKQSFDLAVNNKIVSDIVVSPKIKIGNEV